MSRDPYQLAVDTRDVSIFDATTSPTGKRLTAEHCRDGLREAGARRQLAEMLRGDAMLDIAAWVTAAVEHRVPKTEIARLAGISRPTVDALLRAKT